MNGLPSITAAEGFCELGLFHDAWEELDRLEPALKASVPILRLRLHILLSLSRWQDAAVLGAGCCHQWPNEPAFLLGTARALVRLHDHAKAWELLRHAPEGFAIEPEYHYHVAACACQLGKLEEARAALQACFRGEEKGGTWKQRALDDPALEPIWQSLA